ncbi:MAG: hypothetical protein ACRCXB_22875 [Aeromonadaceae bacterium]
MGKQIIVGLCGSRRIGRAGVISMIKALHPAAVDLTVSRCHRVPWGRAERLEATIAQCEAPVIVAGVCSFEEAQTIEKMGGHVVHIFGPPSEDVPIKRDSILTTMAEPRGRYITVQDMLEQVRERTK